MTVRSKDVEAGRRACIYMGQAEDGWLSNTAIHILCRDWRPVVFGRIRGLPWSIHQRVETLRSNPTSWLLFLSLLGEMALLLMPELHFLVQRFLAPIKVDRGSLQEPLTVTLGEDSGILVTGSRRVHSGEHAPSCTQETWAFSSWAMESVSSLSFLNSSPCLCLKRGRSHIHSLMPKR